MYAMNPFKRYEKRQMLRCERCKSEQVCRPRNMLKNRFKKSASIQPRTDPPNFGLPPLETLLPLGQRNSYEDELPRGESPHHLCGTLGREGQENVQKCKVFLRFSGTCQRKNRSQISARDPPVCFLPELARCLRARLLTPPRAYAILCILIFQ